MSLFKSKLAFGLLFASMAASQQAHALTLNTSGLKADSFITFSVAGSGSTRAAGIEFGGYGNTVTMPSVEVTLPNGRKATVPVYNFPITKVDVSLNFALQATPNRGITNRSALRFTNEFGDVVLANFDVDFKNGILYCDFLDVVGQTSVKRIPLYTFVKTQPDSTSLKGFVLNQTGQIGKLVFTKQASDLLAGGLAIDEVLRATLESIDWGVIDFKVTSYKRTPKLNDRPLTLADVAVTPAP